LRTRRQHFGQHWLTDTHVIKSIIAEAQKDTPASFLEVGPGQGALSELIQAKKSPEQIFWMIEKDPYLIPSLKEKGLSVHEGDAVQLLPHLTALLPKPSVLVSNLPYASGLAILLEALETQSFEKIVIMHQREVIQRLCAGVNSRSRGSLSVWTQTFWHLTPLLSVPPQAFRPPPKVHSEVLVLKPRSQHPLESVLQELDFKETSRAWSAFLKKGFLYPRKMLRSTFSVEHLKSVGIEPSQRPQTLHLEEWVSLFKKERERCSSF
jgi:16S rRNA (adenine1518-N6/adenine1519-N6)-dimethyltransferase